MVLITLRHLVLFISLSNFTLAARTLLGYRRVSAKEASAINARNNIFRDNYYDHLANHNRAAQLGHGVYLSVDLLGYADDPNSW
ncbi:hypothetical protein LX36DRAFT_590966 [Colletotrichum falcatum]|nr:hypothetical protein LX36DRAFT_590966 [Colletotrichum falcatum]